MEILHVFTVGGAWAALLTLAFMEVVLGIDNIVFLSLMTSRLPEHQQPHARVTGLLLAMLIRIGLLFCISLLMQLTTPLWGFDAGWMSAMVTGQSLVVAAGGLFLLYKSVTEIHHKVSGQSDRPEAHPRRGAGFWSIIAQVVVLDAVFSFDSVLTAVGMVGFGEWGEVGAMTLMVTAIMVAVAVMLFFSGAVSRFVNKYPSIQMLALSFLILISMMLVVEAAHLSHLDVGGTVVGEIPRGYIYFAIAFSLFVEVLNLRLAAKRKF